MTVAAVDLRAPCLRLCPGFRTTARANGWPRGARHASPTPSCWRCCSAAAGAGRTPSSWPRACWPPWGACPGLAQADAGRAARAARASATARAARAAGGARAGPAGGRAPGRNAASGWPRPAEVWAHYRARLAHATVEEFWVLGLDVRHRLLFEACVARGSPDRGRGAPARGVPPAHPRRGGGGAVLPQPSLGRSRPRRARISSSPAAEGGGRAVRDRGAGSRGGGRRGLHQPGRARLAVEVDCGRRRPVDPRLRMTASAVWRSQRRMPASSRVARGLALVACLTSPVLASAAARASCPVLPTRSLGHGRDPARGGHRRQRPDAEPVRHLAGAQLRRSRAATSSCARPTGTSASVADRRFHLRLQRRRRALLHLRHRRRPTAGRERGRHEGGAGLSFPVRRAGDPRRNRSATCASTRRDGGPARAARPTASPSTPGSPSGRSSFISIGLVGRGLRDMEDPQAPLTLGGGVALTPPARTGGGGGRRTTCSVEPASYLVIAGGAEYTVRLHAVGARWAAAGWTTEGFGSAGLSVVSEVGALDLGGQMALSGARQQPVPGRRRPPVRSDAMTRRNFSPAPLV